MPRATTKLKSFWIRDESLTFLLGAVVLMVFIVRPLAEFGWPAKVAVGVTLAMVLACGVMVVSDRKSLIVFGWLVGVAALLVDVATWLSSNPLLLALRDTLLLLFLVLLNAVILIRVFREGPVNRHRIQGSILAYVVLGLIWSQAYQLVEIVHPGAFNLPAALTDEARSVSLNYFSFVTLTTVGYGDITPVLPISRSLATLEALTGQLFPAILIARLVALEIEYRRK
jgi:ion channel